RVMHRANGRRTTAVLTALAASLLMLQQGPRLWAAITADFTSPGGETLPIPVTQIAAGPDTAGWELADYSNASGEVLRIIDIVLPTGAQCVGGGLAGTLLAPGAPPPAPPPSCGVGQLLPAGNTCRV